MTEREKALPPFGCFCGPAAGEDLEWENDVVLLDEFSHPLQFGRLETPEVIRWLRSNKPPDLHLVIPGREAPQALIDYAGLVTEMRAIKHPLGQGVKARAGIEF